jgi:hypothetical protein
LVLRKESDSEVRNSNLVCVIRQADYDDGISEDVQSQSIIAQSAFLETPNHTFRLELDTTTVQLLKKVDASSVQLGDICYLITGAVLHDSRTGASKERLIHQKHRRGFKPYIEAKEISRYLPPKSSRFLDYRPKEMHRPKFPELFENDKLMIARIASQVNATIDTTGIYTDHTIDLAVRKDRLKDAKSRDFGITKEEAETSSHYNLCYLLGLMNSRLATFYLQRLLGMAIEINPETARRLPIRRINFADPAEKKQHHDIVALVQEMLELQKEYAEAERGKFRDKADALKRRIEVVDAEIDRIVYQLYGLTDDEIRIVEGGYESLLV